MFSTQLTEAIIEPSALVEGEVGGSRNALKMPLAKARAYAEKVMEKVGKKLDDVLPDFDKNYAKLQAKSKVAMSIPRVQMPVINAAEIPQFEKDLKSGRVDIFKPFAKGALKAYMPGYKLKAGEGAEWLQLGIKDGKKTDDIIKGKWTNFPASKMKPTQNQIWLEKLIGQAAAHGAAGPGSFPTKATISVSRDGYILDGHHRFGQVMLAGPSTGMKALVVPLGIKALLKMGSSYSAAIGNKPKA